ncbi:MAG: alpha/beta hydrolase fold domain-containing protein [Chromatiales bacterium]|nr:alpha/beta hydrolase fold domain-containing protein [Gammaproteobacteria bacterium]MBW6476096.1 alpha/beta hydrolase fold domain-containing protein [Chromatiales bacterium]
MGEPPLPAEIIEPSQPANASVIWLHGLGADGHDFVPIVPELGLDDLPLRFIFPHAPERPVTINMGDVMRAWYDIRSMDLSDGQDDAGTRQSETQIATWIAHEEARGIPSERIFLAGFSQGGAIALHTGLRYPRRLGGIMALSTYLPLADAVNDERHQANLEIPIFMAHGDEDPIIPLSLAERSRQQLQSLGHSVDWHGYAMPHSVCAQEVMHIGEWLRQRLT